MNPGLLLWFFGATTSIVVGCRPRPKADNAIVCQMYPWSQWSSCSKSCGVGQRVKLRLATPRDQEHKDKKCPVVSQLQVCNMDKCPIDCVWGPWSNWSECTRCWPNSRTRLRNVSIPAHFGGRLCDGRDVDYDVRCVEYARCPQTRRRCLEDEFLCSDGLTCVKNHLKCNGDNDCTDNSDELRCNTTWSVCHEQMESIPNIDVVGAGFDITRESESGHVLDNHRYNGRCNTARSSDHGGKLFRQPANVQFFRFQVEVDTSFNVKSYDSLKSFLENEKQDYKHKIQAGSSFSLFGLLKTELNLAAGSSAKMRKIFERGFRSDSKYFKVRSRIGTAQFRTLRRNLMLSVPFRRRVLELPDEYDYGKYAEFIHDFGTHFYSSGVLGGQYELIYRYSRSDLKISGLTDVQQKQCLEFEASLQLFKSEFKFGTDMEFCQSNNLSRRHNDSFIKAAKDVISNVKGGTSTTAAALSFQSKDSPNFANYNRWVDTLKANPAIVDFILRPVSSALTVGSKRHNMEKALLKYMQRFDPTKCRFPCHNHGKHVVVNEGKECKCVCGTGFVGESCAQRID